MSEHPLGRVQNHDPRSRRFAFTAEPAREIRSVSHRRLVPAYSQRVGSCVLNALFGVMSTKPDKHRYRSQNVIERWYSDVTARDPFPGTWNWRTRDGEDTGTDATSACNLLLERGRVSRFEHIFNGLPGLLAALQDRPVAAGMWWLSDMFSTDRDGVLAATGSRVGGHEVYACAVDTDRRLVGFWQSWGLRFGLNGFFWMTYDNVDDRLRDGGDATVIYPRGV